MKYFGIINHQITIHLFAVLLIGGFASVEYGIAQNQSQDNSSEKSSRIGLSAVYSPTSFAVWGKIRKSQSYSIKAQLWYSEFQYRNLNARLGSELIITQHLNYPLNGIDGPRDERLGFGLIPAKILIPFGSTSIKPFGFFSAGLLFLNEKLPAGDGSSLNYLLNLGTGLEFSISKNTNLQIGYSLQHLSNGNSAGQNPGIDYHNFFFSVVL
ncbi:hypothetical protein BH23BAC3_BH23BAC3_21930 [soil metagenome]